MLRHARSGQVLERINGKSVSAIMKDKDWADIHYIRDMLLEARPSTLSLGEQKVITPARHLPNDGCETLPTGQTVPERGGKCLRRGEVLLHCIVSSIVSDTVLPCGHRYLAAATSVHVPCHLCPIA